MAAAKKKAAAKAPSNTISLSVTLTTPDGKKHESEISVVNATGCMMPWKVNSPAEIMGDVVGALRSRYGDNHVKA